MERVVAAWFYVVRLRSAFAVVSGVLVKNRTAPRVRAYRFSNIDLRLLLLLPRVLERPA